MTRELVAGCSALVAASVTAIRPVTTAWNA